MSLMQKVKQTMQNKGKNNTGNNLNPFAVDDSLDAGDAGKPGNNRQQPVANQQQGQQGQQGQGGGPADLSNFFRQSGLFANVRAKDFVEALKNEDIDGLQQMFETMLQDAASTALTGSSRLINARVEKAVSEASESFKTNTQHSLAVEQMHDQLQFTSDPMIAPVAEDILKRYIGKGQSVKEAIASVKSYYAKTAEAAGFKPANQNNQQSGNNRQTNPDNNNSGAGGNDEAFDFVAMLSNGRQNVESVNNVSNANMRQQNNAGANGDENDDFSALNQ